MPHRGGNDECPTNDEGEELCHRVPFPSSLEGHWWGIRHSPTGLVQQERAMNYAFGWAVGSLAALAFVGASVGCTPHTEPSSAPAAGMTTEPTRDPQPGPEIPLMPVLNTAAGDPEKKTEFATGGADDKVPEIKFDGERAVK